MSQPMPEGWTRIEADEAQAALLELLHPTVELEVNEPVFIGASADTTGALFAEPEDLLRVRSIGNNVAHVHNEATGHSALVQLSQLADAGALPYRSGL